MYLTKLKMALGFLFILSVIGTRAGVFAGDLIASSDDQAPATDTVAVPARAVGAAAETKRQIGRIADHIQGNYAHLQSVNVLLQTTHLDRSVTERKEMTYNNPNGTIVQWVQGPFFVQRERVLLRGEDVCREAIGESGQNWAFHDGVWTQYVPASNTAWLRFPEQMPGIFPLDPRNIASLEQRSLFVDRLREDRVIEIGPAQTPAGKPRLAVLMEHPFDRKHAERYRCEFDTARNDLPTRIVFLREESKIGIVLDIDYQEVIPGAAWFLKKVTCKFFGRELARSPDSETWRQATIVETKGKVHVNEPIDANAFALKLPAGTRILDATGGETHKSGERNPRR